LAHHRLAPLASVHGQVSWAEHTDADSPRFPDFPVNGAGSVLAHVPWQSGTAWFAGATYENAADPAMTESQAHGHNLDRIAQLLPDAAAALQPAFAKGVVHAWRGTRWTTSDRLPIVGQWPANSAAAMPSLWISTAMGSRGLTYAALCGELIAAQMGAEPLPLEARLLRFISSGRTRVRL
jgi:tRNA 5-methylaminomethyl-2-thiouridine biosynthesis bifunctional protein